MKRLAYRTVLAWLMAANAMLLAYQAPAGHPLSRVLGAVGLGYVSIMVIAYAAGVAHHLGRGNACRWAHRRQRPASARPAAAAVAVEQPAAEQQHAEAIAAVAADTPLPERTDDTAARPTITTTGVTWGFGPTGVVDAPPEPWTVPDDTAFDALVAQRSAARRRRHAASEGLPAELQEFDYEPAGVAR